MTKFAENSVFHVQQETFNEIDDWIRAAEASGRNAQYGVNALVQLLALTNMGIAQKMSLGPLDPRQTMKSAAWKIPVRRITSRYFKGWKVKRMAPAVWMLYNDSREAYFIEYGIHPSGFKVERRGGKTYLKGSPRVRRPVQKLSLMKTMSFVSTTRVNDRIWETIYAPFRPGRSFSSRGESFILDQVSTQEGMRFL